MYGKDDRDDLTFDPRGHFQDYTAFNIMWLAIGGIDIRNIEEAVLRPQYPLGYYTD